MKNYDSLFMKSIKNDDIEPEIADRIKNMSVLTFSILALMWLFFLLELLIPGLKYDLAIRSKELNITEIIGIMFSWLSHDNFEHIKSNTVGLIGLLLFVGFIEDKPFKLMIFLVLLSGVFTWLLGSANSLHIGASGLVYALFGYIFSSCLLGRKWLYAAPIIISFILYGTAYFSSFMDGLVPRDGISFSAHFGGLLSGLIIGVIYNKKLYLYIKRKNN